MRRALQGLLLSAACVLVASASAQSGPEKRPGESAGISSAELRKLIDTISTGDAQASSDAADELVERLAAAIGDSIGAFDKRPARERQRIRKALERLIAVINLKLFRAELPAEDQKLFDQFVRQRGRIVEGFFSDDDARAHALQSLSLEPGSAAGLLLAFHVVAFPDPSALSMAKKFRGIL